MGLQLYKKKRDFSKTPEPSGSVEKRKGHSFCVQKHDATRLHYDFRLELDGVLLSWAVTKGPSLHPSDKRLAVRTEDHPLSYGDFEGTIPKGQYGGGTVMLWDRGNWSPVGDPREGLKKGNLKFSLEGERLKGEWALVRMKGKPDEKRENWLLIKHGDDVSVNSEKKAADFLEKNAFSIKTGRPMEKIAQGNDVWKSNRPEKKEKENSPQSRAKKAANSNKGKKSSPSLASLRAKYKTVQLATLVTEPPQSEEWVHEIKFDGYRILCFVTNGKVTILSRNGLDWTRKFPRIEKALLDLNVDNAVLDGEAVRLSENGVSNFGDLQEALGEGGEPADIQAYFFDLLHLNGKDYSKRPLLERKDALKKAMKGANEHIHYSEHMDSEKAMLEKACGMGLEGLISKYAQGTYIQGRGKSWLKSKCNKRQEFVIIGYSPAKSGGRAIGSLHLAYRSEGEWKYAGKVGTGFSMSLAKQIYDTLHPMEVAKPPISGIPRPAQRNSFWVEPKLLCEVTFTEWTRDGHVRHPSFEGLRADKKPTQVKKETPMKTSKAVKAKAPTAKKVATKKSAAKKEEGTLVVRGITVTHPERPFFKEDNITKGDIVEYYGAVAPFMLKQIKKRPISLLRCPSGAGDCFFQRNPDQYMKKMVKPFSWTSDKGNKHEYLYIENEAGLVFLAQMGVIEIHPWGATVDKIDHPLQMIFDLDPDEGMSFDVIKMAALDIKQRLENEGFKNIRLKCSGGKGLHVTAPLDGKKKWDVVKEKARQISERAAGEVPDAYTATMSKAKRKGKIFIDFFRNDYTATAIADYSVRARPGAPVAVPLDWDELDGLKSANQFSMKDVLKRLKL